MTTIRYETDVVAWANEQARLIRARQFEQLDLEHIAEEIEDVGKSEQRELASRMAVLIAHLLKWQYQPERQSSSWRRTIQEQRKALAFHIKQVPSLKTKLADPDWQGAIWADAVTLAINETGMGGFPEDCPWTVEDILYDDFLPENNAADMQYSKCYVAYLDVLGFKDLVLSDKPDDKKKVATYVKLSKAIIENVQELPSDSNKISGIAVSDAIILSAPFASEHSDNISGLRGLCLKIREIQFQLAELNIWIRGGISFGSVHLDASGKQIIGPAYIGAYLLEQGVALYPRVVIDSKLVRELGVASAQSIIEKVNASEGEYCPLKRNVLFEWRSLGVDKYGLEKDVPLFIDYLAYCFSDEGKLDKIINNIEERIYTNPETYSKYRWLINYLIASCYHHNNFLPAINTHDLRAGLQRLQNL